MRSRTGFHMVEIQWGCALQHIPMRCEESRTLWRRFAAAARSLQLHSTYCATWLFMPTNPSSFCAFCVEERKEKKRISSYSFSCLLSQRNREASTKSGALSVSALVDLRDDTFGGIGCCRILAVGSASPLLTSPAHPGTSSIEATGSLWGDRNKHGKREKGKLYCVILKTVSLGCNSNGSWWNW